MRSTDTQARRLRRTAIESLSSQIKIDDMHTHMHMQQLAGRDGEAGDEER